MKLTVDLQEETDGNWVVEIADLGVTAYGPSPEAASRSAKALALRVLADQIETGELSETMVEDVSFGE